MFRIAANLENFVESSAAVAPNIDLCAFAVIPDDLQISSRKPLWKATYKNSMSKPKRSICISGKSGRNFRILNALKPHCVSRKGKPVIERTTKLKTLPPCSRRHDWCVSIRLLSSSREPKVTSNLSSRIGSTSFGNSSIGVDKSASEKARCRRRKQAIRF